MRDILIFTPPETCTCTSGAHLSEELSCLFIASIHDFRSPYIFLRYQIMYNFAAIEHLSLKL